MPLILKKVTKEDVYKLLAQHYRFTFNEIAEMNHWQQLALCDIDSTQAQFIEFPDMESYLKWKTAGGK